MLHRISAVGPAVRAGVNHREAMVCFFTNQEHYRTDPFVAAAEMTVVRLRGKTPHPIDGALRAKLEKHLLPGL